MYHYVYERRFMAKHKVEINNINTSSLKVLSSEETLELFNKMHEGDIFARDNVFYRIRINERKLVKNICRP